MDEYFLHFLWQYQKFTSRELHTESGEALHVLSPGHSNPNSGPDFLEAQLLIDGLKWAGSVEVHHKSSDWLLHGHSDDQKYENVILHVVWQHDKEITNSSGTKIPTFCLSQNVHPDLELEYRRYINQPETIRCGNNLSDVPQIRLVNMLDQALTERLHQKAETVLKSFRSTNSDWEETSYQFLARSFGFSVNQDPFLTLAKHLPYRILMKHLDQPHQVESLVFGMAGFLSEPPADDHQKYLRSEFEFLAGKHGLSTPLSRMQWKYSRLRPANFPTVRLAQFTQFIIRNTPIFGSLLDPNPVASLRMSDYWLTHFDFGKKLKSGENHFGQSALDHLSINLKAPILAAYSIHLNDTSYLDAATTLLSNVKPESNKITKEWALHGVAAKSAYDSQALIQKYKQHCIRKKCIRCTVGMAILNR